MNKRSRLLFSLAALGPIAAFAQSSPPPPSSASVTTTTAPATVHTLTKFDLDFPGGTPRELVTAIENAMHRPLNAIIPDEYANQRIPALKMSRVDAAQLFRGLAAIHVMETIVQSGRQYPSETSCGFLTTDNPGYQSDDTVWYFFLNRAGAPFSVPQNSTPKVSRFYLLTPYLAAGLSVDDITTAIQTGWKMRNEPVTPSLSFHKETKLLIAVGDPQGLETIEAVLHALDGSLPKSAVTPGAAPGEPKTKP